MRPNLIPHTFVAKNMRKRYHRRCAERTWQQWLVDYQNVLLFMVGLMFVLTILYIRHTDKQTRIRKREEEQRVSYSDQYKTSLYV